ncbi:MAG: PD-(D/E)XK nuclease family protein [Prevotella sp.]|nr:PD-(D/E)XK nuclease family protein [Prevotella sp.]
MKSFLEYVAADLLQKYGTNLSRIAVVFPNKRAALFLNEHLARLTGKPLWSPAYITISDLFRKHSQRQVADSIQLVCELHQCFTQCTGIDETLDHFYGWGQLLLSDFDDIDKNMASAEHVFANLRDIHEYDDTSYLTEEQRITLQRFFSNFNEEHNSELKQRFLQLWSHILDIYQSFNDRLAKQGLAYEGALYREVAEREDIEFEYDTYLFIGFNMLQQVEQTLFRRMKQQGKARFYWDYDHYYLNTNEAGYFIAQYLNDFPNELDDRNDEIYSNFTRQKTINYISAPTENIQARYIDNWLQKQNRIADNRRTAVVLCNENLLQTAIHCIPSKAKKVNITTGYPLSQTPITSFVNLLVNLQTNGYVAETGHYRLRHVNHVLRHPYSHHVSTACNSLYDELNAQKIYYPDATLLSKDEGLQLLFSMAHDSADRFNSTLLLWLMSVIRQIAKTVSKDETESSPLTQESLFRMYTLLNRLSDLVEKGSLQVDTITLQRLITQIVSATSIPFHGEPVEGIQIMGVLETRNIDFEHVLLLSCNEGNLPKGLSDTSFIPYSIRKAYGLTTIDHKVAIYAYYFHRLLQRASDITLVYNNSTNDGQTGEMSRFMLQMMVESGHKVNIQALMAGQVPIPRTLQPIEKSDAVMQILRKHFEANMLTPTAINRYMRCQLQFFYRYVSGIIEPDNDDEDAIDNRVFGNIFHLAAHILYKKLMQKSRKIMAADIEYLLQTEVDIHRAVDEAIKQELFHIKDATRPLPPLDGLQIINREVIIKYIRQLLEIDRRLTPFSILKLEKPEMMDYEISIGKDTFSTTLGGTIDRLDSITTPDGTEQIRVIDYKTGSRRLKALADVDAIFAQESLKDHSDYYLQAFLYSHIVRLKSKNVPVAPALLFIQHAGSEDYDPTLCLGREPVNDIANYSEAYMKQLDSVISDIFNPAISFTPTDDRKQCQHCPYANLCGIS